MTNILDFEAAEFTPTWLEQIFEKQNALLNKYKDIEKMPDLPVNINTAVGQKVLKDFLWRTHEELAESYEAYHFKSIELDNEKNAAHYTHQIEELIDALHFIVELIIIAGKDHLWAREQLDTATDILDLMPSSEESVYWQTAYYLGLVGNTLKNKPWKQSQMPTDEDKFFLLLGKSFKALFVCLKYCGADEETVFSYYDRKNQVNQFRQRSNY